MSRLQNGILTKMFIPGGSEGTSCMGWKNLLQCLESIMGRRKVVRMVDMSGRSAKLVQSVHRLDNNNMVEWRIEEEEATWWTKTGNLLLSMEMRWRSNGVLLELVCVGS